jgi:peptide chain release factor 1
MDNTSQIAFVEIRGATGGDEAKLWGNDLLRMYSRYAGKKGWTVIPIDDNVIKIKGVNAYDLLKNESGVHRVQRIPTTERHGRIHTSTATVVILPEIKENDIKLNNSDLEIQFFHSSSQGGQNVQKVSTAVRLIHKPTGIIVSSQRERFQEQNRRLAEDLLRTRLWEKEEEEKMKTVAGYRSAIGRGMRSEKIRTYNFPQDRITDHRIGKSWGNLERIVDGEMDKITDLTKDINP